MNEDTSSEGRGLGWLAPAVGIAGFVATLMLGPIDLGRSVYNGIIGDTPVLKEQLLDYSRRDIKRKIYRYMVEVDDKLVEMRLAEELNYKYDLKSGRIDSQKISVENLWDASEVHARSWYQQWIWSCLNDD